jgi:hypothetical protein
MTARKTQQQRILEVLQSVRDGTHQIDSEYIAVTRRATVSARATSNR